MARDLLAELQQAQGGGAPVPQPVPVTPPAGNVAAAPAPASIGGGRDLLALSQAAQAAPVPGPEAQTVAPQAGADGVINLPNVGDFNLQQPQEITALQRATGRDPNVLQSGIDDFSLRADISQGDTAQEREALLINRVGKDGFTRDSFGNLAITPAGQQKLGLPPKDRPIRLDEPGLSLNDLADLRGIAPALLGATAAGVATSGLGFFPALAAVGAGGAAGKAIDELGEEVAGRNLQTAGEVATDVAIEGAAGAAGEGVFRGILAPLGRKILAPNQAAVGRGGRVREGGQELVDEAAEIGAVPQLSNVTNRRLLNRLSGAIETIFGDLNAGRNAGAFNKEIDNLRNAFNAELKSPIELGTAIKEDVKAARKSFSEEARAAFALVDEILPGEEIIPTRQIKEVAAEIFEAFPKSADGNPVLVGDRAVAPQQIQEILSLPENVSVEQLQALRGTLNDLLEVGTATPGAGTRDAARLLEGAGRALDDAIESLPTTVASEQEAIVKGQALQQLRTAREFYAKGIRQFDNATIRRLVKDEGTPGQVDAEKVMGLLFKKGSQTPIRNLYKVASKERKAEFQTAAMNKLMEDISTRSNDPLQGLLFDGTKFLKTLDGVGKETLDEVFGADVSKRLSRLGRVIQSASRQKKDTSGGLVAAQIAMNPLQNLPKLVKFRVLGQVLSSDTGIRWLTQGIAAPRTRAGTAALSRLAAQVQQLSDEFTVGGDFKEDAQNTSIGPAIGRAAVDLVQ